MMICGFAPDFSHSEKQSRPHAPIQSTHGYGSSTVLAHGFSARDRKTRQNVGGRTDGDRTGHQAASKQNRRTTTLCTVFNICLVVEFLNTD